MRGLFGIHKINDHNRKTVPHVHGTLAPHKPKRKTVLPQLLGIQNGKTMKATITLQLKEYNKLLDNINKLKEKVNLLEDDTAIYFLFGNNSLKKQIKELNSKLLKLKRREKTLIELLNSEGN